MLSTFSDLDIMGKVKRLKVRGQDTSYSAAYMSQTQEQQRFTTSEVAADWHKLMIPQRIMQPSTCIARASRQLNPWCS